MKDNLKCRKLLLAAVLPLMLFCAPALGQELSPDRQEFVVWLESLEKKVEQNPNIKEIQIQTEQQADHLLSFVYALYEKKISKEHFLGELNNAYPGNSEFLQWITKQIPTTTANKGAKK